MQLGAWVRLLIGRLLVRQQPNAKCVIETHTFHSQLPITRSSWFTRDVIQVPSDATRIRNRGQLCNKYAIQDSGCICIPPQTSKDNGSTLIFSTSPHYQRKLYSTHQESIAHHDKFSALDTPVPWLRAQFPTYCLRPKEDAVKVIHDAHIVSVAHCATTPTLFLVCPHSLGDKPTAPQS